MTPVRTISGRAYPLGADNIDTDIIIPSRWLKTITRAGLGRGAFESLRAGGDTVFDDPRHAGARILIAGTNFGCGSSREHAVWALADMGIDAVIAVGFSDIFAGNAFKNGMVTVALPPPAIERLLTTAGEGSVMIDLDTMTVTGAAGDRFDFALDPFRRHCLREGLDEVGLTLAAKDSIAAYEARLSADRPWTMQGTAAA